MTLWRKTRTEVGGAYRSLRYDLGRREDEAPVGPPAPLGDVTSTGMSTFGGVAERAGAPGDPDAFRRPPRRAVAVAAFGTLAVAGAAGSYFAVVNGLGALLTGEPAAREPYPLAIGDSSADQVASNAGLGKGTAERPAAAQPTAVPPVTTAAGVPVTPPTQPAPRPPAVTRTTPAQPGPPPSDGCGDCNEPPVPTPTAPSESPSSPADSEPPSPEPTDSSAAPDPTDTASADPSGEPSADGRRGHRRH